MNTQDTLFLIGLIVLSVLTSFLFIFYGMSIIMADVESRGLIIFAYVTTAYGLANIAILSVAWGSRDAWSTLASKFIAMCYLGIFIMDMINAGMKSPVGVVGILVVVLVLWANYFAVKKVVERG